MKKDKTSRTAQYMALFRALETERDSTDQLFSDSYAIHFLEAKLRFAARMSKYSIIRKYISKKIQKKIPGAFSSGIARTKYIDDLLKQSISNGVKQVIILGAGFDTRALRLDFLKSVPVIEIDHPNTSNFKTVTYQKSIGSLPENIAFYQIDFNKQSLDELAIEHNFDFSKPTTIIWEGVTNYLTETAIKRTFSFISNFPKDSYVIFTYVHKKILENPGSFLGGKKLLKDLDKLEEKWTFGFLPEELPDYLKQFNMSLIEDKGALEYREIYLPNRPEKGYEFYRVAMAIKQ
ncbi:class I SAM-dependent methyltransferase [Flavobacterium sp. ANB]|uniref:class I SAM-dependent methyltransferase n=1 Tax=unclassified Flavobacterium TaxID=196869 RepID=UPI0012B90A2D|nr:MULTISPECIES: SAM-dependent methyltransferase [unclassified Flavobacterium]MBF4515955.1 class I SAM-dependent methyltransferase [Flavobacterium sp. ANB]MTD68957.1 SAM-dependent methyltransferase [Flavobacterium sp. LC2016-13]